MKISIPAVARMTVHILAPCLPVLNHTARKVRGVSASQIETSQMIWARLSPAIANDAEAQAAIIGILDRPHSPVWNSTLEQALIGILKENHDLAESLATILKIPS
ncbi:MAG: hypothetical protein AAF152_12020 [Cyanobacteria bacterium P01_A01_bin.114]